MAYGCCICSVVVREDKKLLTVLFPDGRDGRAFTLKVLCFALPDIDFFLSSALYFSDLLILFLVRS